MVIIGCKRYIVFLILTCIFISINIRGLVSFSNFLFGPIDGFDYIVWCVSALFQSAFYGLGAILSLISYIIAPVSFSLGESKKLNRFLLLFLGTICISGFFVQLLEAISFAP